MSRFFRAGSDSESESESSDDGIQESRPIAQTRCDFEIVLEHKIILKFFLVFDNSCV